MVTIVDGYKSVKTDERVARGAACANFMQLVLLEESKRIISPPVVSNERDSTVPDGFALLCRRRKGAFDGKKVLLFTFYSRWWIQIHTSSPTHILLLLRESASWLSTDDGNQWKGVFHSPLLNSSSLSASLFISFLPHTHEQNQMETQICYDLRTEVF